VIKVNYGRSSAISTRYDKSELLDTVLEMVHVQDIFEHRRDFGTLCEDRHPVPVYKTKKVAITLTSTDEYGVSLSSSTGLYLLTIDLQLNTDEEAVTRTIEKTSSWCGVHLYCPGFHYTSGSSEEEISISSMENPTTAEKYNQDYNADNANM
jgi:hypothetical protein